ncbi:tetratricopeptide repeat protein, partial [Patescibacteria group bacterium]|nr:tetratricopeptide repeat protein [Patescibacteria group bacterium]
MYSLLIILVIAVALVYVIWKFTKPKSASYGIEVVTKESELRRVKDEITGDTEDSGQLSEVTVGSDDSTKKVKKLKSETEKECIEQIFKNPKDINAYLRLSVYYLQRQKWSDAKEVLLEALKVEPDNDKILNNLGIVWYRLKRYNN